MKISLAAALAALAFAPAALAAGNGGVNFHVDHGGKLPGSGTSPRYSDVFNFSGKELTCAAAPLKSLPPNASPADERKAVAQSFLLWEQLLAQKFSDRGLTIDKGYQHLGFVANLDTRPGQMNCWNVSENTGRYLAFLQDHGLLHQNVVKESHKGDQLDVDVIAQNLDSDGDHWGAWLGEKPQSAAQACGASPDPAACASRYASDPAFRQQKDRDYGFQHKWVLDRWHYDMGAGICVQSAADWQADADCKPLTVPPNEIPSQCDDVLRRNDEPASGGGGGGGWLSR